MQDTDGQDTDELPACAPGASMEWSERKMVLLQQRLEAAMAGNLARSRPLKYWENLKLKPQHLQMILMKSSGFRNVDIAEAMHLTQARVSVILKHQDAQSLLAMMVSFAADNTLDVRTRIKAHSGEMLDLVLDTVRTTNDAKLRTQGAFKLLEMAGYGAVQKIETKATVTIEGPEASQLKDAIREAQQMDEEDEIESSGRYVVEGVDEPDKPEEPEEPTADSKATPTISIVRAA